VAVELYRIDRLNRTLCQGIALFDESNRGRGLGTTALALVLDYVFNQMNFRQTYGELRADNEGSRRMNEKVGAEFIGARRHAYYVDGRYVDQLVTIHRRDRFNVHFRKAHLG
jgi:RimJ/RimL family protein N-acetyltransferase